MDAQMTSLQQRIERLETQGRRTRLVAGGVVGVLLVLLVGGQSRPEQPSTVKVVEAERFVLRDVNGKIRSEWAVDDGEVAIRFANAKSEFVASMSVHLGGESRIRLFNPSNPRVLSLMVSASRDGNARLGITNRKQTGGVFVGTAPTGPLILLKDGEDKNRVVVSVNVEDGAPVLALKDVKGVARAVLGSGGARDKATGVMQRHPESSLLLYNEDGKVIFEAP